MAILIGNRAKLMVILMNPNPNFESNWAKNPITADLLQGQQTSKMGIECLDSHATPCVYLCTHRFLMSSKAFEIGILNFYVSDWKVIYDTSKADQNVVLNKSAKVPNINSSEWLSLSWMKLLTLYLFNSVGYGGFNSQRNQFEISYRDLHVDIMKILFNLE